MKAEIAEKHARSIAYQLGITKLPLAKELTDFRFADTPINEALVRDLSTGAFLIEAEIRGLSAADRRPLRAKPLLDSMKLSGPDRSWSRGGLA